MNGTPSPQSRIAAGRARALLAKKVLAAGAVGALAVFGVLARSSHAGAGSSEENSSNISVVDNSYSEDSSTYDYDYSGGIGSTDETPQVQTGTS